MYEYLVNNFFYAPCNYSCNLFNINLSKYRLINIDCTAVL